MHLFHRCRGPPSPKGKAVNYAASGYPYALNYTVGETTTLYYYITNLQGDVLHITDSSGNIVVTYSFVETGKLIDMHAEKGGGLVYTYEKIFTDLGVRVVLSIWVSADGLIQKISDAIPYIIN